MQGASKGRVLLEAGLTSGGAGMAKALREAGWEVETAIYEHMYSAASIRRWHSRYMGNMHVLPSAFNHPGEFQNAVLQLCREGNFDVLLPTGQEGTAALVEIQDMLHHYVSFAFPDPQKFLVFHDKERLHRWVQEKGISVPAFYNPDRPDELDQIRYPVVIKGRRNSGVGHGLRYAANRRELDEALAFFAGANRGEGYVMDLSRPFIQEYIPGKIYDYSAIYDHGRPVFSTGDIRLVTYPAQGGVSTVIQGLHDEGFYRWAQSVVDGLDWHGPLMVEAIRDERDGEYKLLEVNPRIWGVVDMELKGGVNIPDLMCDLAQGRHPDPVVLDQSTCVFINVFPRLIMNLVSDRKRRWKLLRRCWRWWRNGAVTNWQKGDWRINFYLIREALRYCTKARRQLVRPIEAYCEDM